MRYNLTSSVVEQLVEYRQNCRRREMKKLLWSVCLFVGLALSASAADQTLTGKISDSMCGASHAKMIAEHPDMKTDHNCAVACVKSGAKYVFVSGGKVYNIDNQDFADLEKGAGRTVRLTGDVNGDTITVSKIAMPEKKST
jgi:hypothetical protein